MYFFEAVMLICFGASWPMAIYKTLKTKNPVGKSLIFLYLVEIGYIAGCINKVINSMDWVLWLYIVNTMMVATDIYLVTYYNRRNRLKAAPDHR